MVTRIDRRRARWMRPRPERSRAPGELGWLIHAAMESWTGRADLKASILLALQGAALLFLVSGRDLLLSSRSRWPVLLGLAALVLLVVATCLAAWAIMPILGSARRLRVEHHDHVIFFGHIRLWKPDDLSRRLADVTPAEEDLMIARQLVFLSHITWRKHRLLQASVLLTIVVIVALVTAFTFVGAVFR